MVGVEVAAGTVDLSGHAGELPDVRAGDVIGNADRREFVVVVGDGGPDAILGTGDEGLGERRVGWKSGHATLP